MPGTWIKVAAKLPQDPKVYMAARLLFPTSQPQIAQERTLGQLVKLWCWVAEHVDDGIISEPAAAAAIAGWPRRPLVFMDALAQAGFLVALGDGTYQVHNWEHWFGALQRQRTLSAERMQRHRNGDVTRNVPLQSSVEQNSQETVPTEPVPGAPSEPSSDVRQRVDGAQPKSLDDWLLLMKAEVAMETGSNPVAMLVCAANDLKPDRATIPSDPYSRMAGLHKQFKGDTGHLMKVIFQGSVGNHTGDHYNYLAAMQKPPKEGAQGKRKDVEKGADGGRDVRAR